LTRGYATIKGEGSGGVTSHVAVSHVAASHVRVRVRVREAARWETATWTGTSGGGELGEVNKLRSRINCTVLI